MTKFAKDAKIENTVTGRDGVVILDMGGKRIWVRWYGERESKLARRADLRLVEVSK